ncbi:tRNA modification GTPase, putative [Babesia ovata]|uniref:tRNA modification GTPase, putative n=1 Tax=Babesia ovata TaxID=189622 RepID=A0A2H6K7F0_9APIC|nr:tRNA modification GTPase, putative [Babesia ovata]GBE58921.1 tRNA modification GTPase, putative [Babesia ovata]
MLHHASIPSTGHDHLNGCCEQAQLHRVVFVVHGFRHVCEVLSRVWDLRCVLAYDPDQRGFRLDGVQVLAVGAHGEELYVEHVRVRAQQVAVYDGALLGEVRRPEPQQLVEGGATGRQRSLQADTQRPYSPYSPPHEVMVDVCGVLRQLCQYLLEVAGRGKSHHDLQLLDTDVQRVAALAEEGAHVSLKQPGPLFDDHEDRAQRHVLDLRVQRRQRHQRRGQLALQDA